MKQICRTCDYAEHCQSTTNKSQIPGQQTCFQIMWKQNKTSALSNLMQGRIATADQSYSPGGANVHPTHDSLFFGPTQVHIPNGILIGSAVFAQLTTESSILYNGSPVFRLKIAHSHGRSGFHVIHGFFTPWAHLNPYPKRHLDRLSRFCMAHYCGTPTDRPHYSVCNNRPRLRT